MHLYKTVKGRFGALRGLPACHNMEETRLQYSTVQSGEFSIDFKRFGSDPNRMCDLSLPKLIYEEALSVGPILMMIPKFVSL